MLRAQCHILLKADRFFGMPSLVLNDAHTAFAAGGCRYIDLGVTVVRIAPPPAFEQTVRSRNAAQGDPIGQIATSVNHATSELAYIQRLPAWMLAGG
jgi:hypothetical protein